MLDFSSIGFAQKKELETYQVCQREDISSLFDKVACNYDSAMCSVGYPDPELICNVVQDISSERGLSLDKVEIIDFGCGTGQVGLKLKEKGVKHMTGIDCSKAMLEIAKKKGVYSSLHNILLGGEDYV